jgi:hypothetical protein
MQTTHFQYTTADSAWSSALPRSLDGPQTLVLAFGPRALLAQSGALHELAVAFPSSVLMGCSSAGAISSGEVNDGSVSVVLARFDHTPLQRVSTPLKGVGDSFDAGSRLAAQLAPEGLRAVFILCSGLAVNGSALVRGVGQGLPAGVKLSGGLAADGSLFERTWVLDGGEPLENVATAVGLYGDALLVGHGCSGGWTEFGPERQVTQSDGNVLYELDGQPALALYKNYLGDLAAQLPSSALLFPLALRASSGNAGTVVRTILAVDEASQAMVFAGDMPVGSTVRLMRTSVDNLVTSAEQAGQRAVQLLGHPGGHKDAEGAACVLAVSVSCIGRRLVMGERTEEEVEAVVEQLPQGAVHGGFYSYGEIAPANSTNVAELHNQTMTLTVFSEG